MNKSKKVSLRKCVVTNKMFPKQELIRVVKTLTGEIVIDTTGKLNGRGAYISPNLVAYNLAKKNKSLEKHLKTKINEEFYCQLYNEISNNWD